MSDTAILELREIERHFRQAKQEVQVLKSVSLTLRAGETVALVGASGSGKSTLLQVAGLLDGANGGTLLMNGKDVTSATDSERTLLRRRALGFVYQYHYLLSDFKAWENIALPLRLNGVGAKEARKQALDLLDSVGLAERAEHRPSRLSGGEQQRVALCRALVHTPRLVLADEPTGNLDADSAEMAFALLQTLVRRTDAAVLLATHNAALAAKTDRVFRLEGGLLHPA